MYAHVRGFEQHGRARGWLDDSLTREGRVGLPWQSLVAFVRLVTNPRVFGRPESTAAAWRQVERWLEAEPAWVPVPTERHREILGRLLHETDARGNVVHDAHLAALALEHGLTVASTDGDFARFRGVRWVDPLRHDGGARA